MDLVKNLAKQANINSAKINNYAEYLNPCIIEERKLNATPIDVFSRLMMDRIIFLGTEINADIANIIQAQLLYLSFESNDPISLYLNTPGGEISSGLGIYDTMQIIPAPVNTICTGMAASMGAILLSAGKERSILPHSKVMIHQPWGGAMGSASDILIEAREIEKSRDELCKILSEHTKQKYDKVLKDIDRDYWMNAEEALEYHIVDKILIKK